MNAFEQSRLLATTKLATTKMANIKTLCCLAICLASLFTIPAITSGQDAATEAHTDALERVERIFARASSGDLDKVWPRAAELEELAEEDEEVFELLRDQLGGTGAGRLLAAKALITVGEVDDVDTVLIEIAGDEEIPVPHRQAALRMLRLLPSNRVDRALEKMLGGDEYYDPALRVAAASALSSEKRSLARESLRPLLDVDDSEVRSDAALRLAELGSPHPRVRQILFSLQNEPTAAGIQAKLLLDNLRILREGEIQLDRVGVATSTPKMNERLHELELQVSARDQEIEELRAAIKRRGGSTPDLITKLLQVIHESYVDPHRLDKTRLIVEAAKGMVGSLDPYSSFMDAVDTNAFNEDMAGEYAGIGAEVGRDPESGYLTILRPIYQGPAYRTGLRTHDIVTEVEGVRIKGLPFEDMVKQLKGAAGTEVRVKVLRRGWQEERDFVIRREVIHLESVLTTILPGDIGYLALHRFGDTAVSEFSGALDTLEGQGMKGLIIDLRNNPGGYLTSAVEIVDSFVVPDGTDRAIVSQRGGSPNVPSPSPRMPTGYLRGDYPIVVLVNRASASASEIVAGALKDFERATIVGERTFGKGSVQRLIDMPRDINEQLGGPTTLRLTVQYYYLPNDRSIHTVVDGEGRIIEKGGVDPDITVKPESVALYRLEAVNELEKKSAFRDYLGKYYAKHRDTFRNIAEHGDNGSTDMYPDFDAHFGPLNTANAAIDDVRIELRQYVRQRVEDERGKQLACDYPQDRQLQRGILALLEKLGTPATELAEYTPFAESFSGEDETPKSEEF